MAIPLIRSITDLARDARALVAEVQRRQQPIVITQRGREAAVLVPVDLYRQLEAGAGYHLLVSPRLAHSEDAAGFELEVTREGPTASQVAED